VVEKTPLGKEVDKAFEEYQENPFFGLYGAMDEIKRRDEARREADAREERRKIPLPLTRYPILEVPETPTPSIARGFAEVKRPQRTEMNNMEPALREVINNERILVTPEMLPFINDPGIIVDEVGIPARKMTSMNSRQFERQAVLPKKKRKVSKYQKEFGRQLKMLKKKFPRTPVTKLMKRAHAATRKALK
jgi:hypothetical protein